MSDDLYDSNSFEQRVGDAIYRTSERLRRATAPKALKRLLLPALGVAYAAIGFVTFGHVAARNYRADQYEYAACDRARGAKQEDSYDRCPQPMAIASAALGAGAGVFWPFYLSWEAQQ